MRDFRGTLLSAGKNKLAQDDSFVWLFEVQVPTEPPTRMRITNFQDQVSRGKNSNGDDIIYYPVPALGGDFVDTQKGDLSSLTLTVSNATLEIMEYLELYDGLKGQPVTIRVTSRQSVLEPNADLRYDGIVTGCSVDDEVVSFNIGAPNLTATDFPRHRYSASHCRWRFGSVECGYVIPAGADDTVGGGFTTCPMLSLANCEERGDDEVARGFVRQHPKRFGGFKGTQRA